ncbi:MAG: hypothetical protein M1839_006771 [Geoglossum umbratile]|nr:MAG: hypothetical protein M1839_006771 [Geoglossum umbratile]
MCGIFEKVKSEVHTGFEELQGPPVAEGEAKLTFRKRLEIAEQRERCTTDKLTKLVKCLGSEVDHVITRLELERNKGGDIEGGQWPDSE